MARPAADPFETLRAARTVFFLPGLTVELDNLSEHLFEESVISGTETESAAAAALTREEGFEQAGKSREIARLHQHLAGAGKFGDHTFAAQKAAKETALGRLAELVIHIGVPGDEMAGVDDILLARPEHTAVYGSE